MRTFEEMELEELKCKELAEIRGGSEFSESVFRGLGWAAGQIVNAFNAMADSFGSLHASGTPYTTGLGRAI